MPIWAALAVATLGGHAASHGLAPQPLNQPENPIFINDSPAAAETLLRTMDHVRSGNLEQAVRLIQKLLDESGDLLTPSASDPALFVTVRSRAHETLLAERVLLARYREVQGPTALDQYQQGRDEVLERSMLLTQAGFDGAVRLARAQMESGSFGLARLTLEQLAPHPDRTGVRAAAAADLAATLARYDRTAQTAALARAWAGEGADLTPIAQPPGVANPPRSAFEPAGPIDVSGIVAKPLWTVQYGESTPVDAARLPIAASPETLPAFGRELRSFPAVSGDTVFVAGERYVAAYNRFTLEEKWRVDAVAAAGVDTDPWDREGAVNRGQRRASQASQEDVVSVAVRGSTVVAVIGLEPPNATEGQELLIALDAASGSVRWARTAQSLDPALVRTHVRAPVVIDGPVAVIGCRKWQPDRRLTAVYLAGVDLETGRSRWTALVGSAGSLPFYRQAQVADGGALADGVVYRLDRIGLLAAYTAQTGRPLWVRRFGSEPIDAAAQSFPWQINLPVVDGPWLYAVAPDRTGVVRVERASGRVDGLIPSDRIAGPAYVVRAGRSLAAVSDNRIALIDLDQPGDFAARTVTLSGVIAGPGLRGRVVPSGTNLLAPVLAGVLAFDAGRITATPISIDLDDPGNILACEEQLVVVDDARVHSYLSWERADAVLTERVTSSPADPAPAITLTELSFRAGKPDRLVFAADAAARAIAATAEAEVGHAARRRLFDGLAGMVESSLTAASTGPRLAPADAGEVVERLGRLGVLPGERATYLLLSGALLARRPSPPQAVEAYQRILADAALAGAVWPSARGPVNAGEEATRRLEDIIASSGRSAYGAFDAQARVAIEALGPSPAAEVMEALARRYPLAQEAPGLWLRIGAAHRDANRPRAEARALEIGLQRAEGMPDAPLAVVGEMAGRLIENLKGRGLLVAAGEVLQRFQSRFAQAPLTLRGVAMDATRLRSDLGAELLAQRRWPKIGGPRAEAAQIITGWTIVEPEVRPPTGSAPPFVVMRNEEGRVSLWGWGRADGPQSVAPLEALWTSDPIREPVALVRADSQAAYLYTATPAGGVLTRIDAQARTQTWRSQPFGAYFQPGGNVPTPMLTDRVRTPLDGIRPINELIVCTDDRSIAMVERTGRCVILDNDTGNVLWSGRVPLVRIVDCGLIAGELVAAGEKETRGPGGNVTEVAHAVAAIEARTGDVKREFPITSGPARWLRLTDAGDLIIATQTEVSSFDLETANANWRLSAGPAATSVDAWVIHDRLLILGEDRTLWQVSVASGAAGASALDTRGRFDSAGPVYAGITASGAVAFRSQQGIVVFDGRGGLIGADAVGATDNLVTPAASAAGFVAVSTSGVPAKDNDSMGLYPLHLFGERGELVSTVQLQLGAMPGTLALIDGRIIVSAGRHTVVYQAP